MLVKEISLYAPVKSFLEAQGYEVKGEVRGCDLVGVRGGDLVVVELKRAINLTLVLQGLERQRMTDAVYLAVEEPRRADRRFWRDCLGLCRRLGLGLITVRFGSFGPRVEVLCDPGPYQPRKAVRRRGLLLGEFRSRTGDYNVGGGTRRPLVTAYREEALRIAGELRARGALKVKEVREATGCAKAGSILAKNFYGWFERAERGVYRLTPRGEEALARYADVLR